MNHYMKKPAILLALAGLCTIGACTKGGGVKDPIKKDKPAADTTFTYLTSGTWMLHETEYPSGANSWGLISDAFSYNATVFAPNGTFTISDGTSVVVSGTWGLSGSVLTRTYDGATERDTIDQISPAALKVVIPRQVYAWRNFYDYYRVWYILKK